VLPHHGRVIQPRLKPSEISYAMLSERVARTTGFVVRSLSVDRVLLPADAHTRI
jgi:hypothetical protein